MEWPYELIHLKICWSAQRVLAYLLQVIFKVRLLFESITNFLCIFFGDPKQSSQILAVIYSKFIHRHQCAFVDGQKSLAYISMCRPIIGLTIDLLCFDQITSEIVGSNLEDVVNVSNIMFAFFLLS